MTRSSMLLMTLALLLSSQGAEPAWAHPGASTTIEHYTHEIEHDPGNQSLYIRRGIAYSNDGRFDAALADFRKAETLGDPILVSCDLGVLYFRRGEPETAVRHLDRYLAKFPPAGYCLEFRARARREAGDLTGAIRDFRRVIDTEPKPNPGLYISVATMLEEGGEEGIDEALAVIDSGLEKLGLTPQLQHRAIELELLRRRPDLALARGQALRVILGDSPTWKVDMAELHLRVGDAAEAEALLQDANAQLATLRKTPARLRLSERISTLSKHDALATGSPGREPAEAGRGDSR